MGWGGGRGGSRDERPIRDGCQWGAMRRYGRRRSVNEHTVNGSDRRGQDGREGGWSQGRGAQGPSSSRVDGALSGAREGALALGSKLQISNRSMMISQQLLICIKEVLRNFTTHKFINPRGQVSGQSLRTATVGTSVDLHHRTGTFLEDHGVCAPCRPSVRSAPTATAQSRGWPTAGTSEFAAAARLCLPAAGRHARSLHAGRATVDPRCDPRRPSPSGHRLSRGFVHPTSKITKKSIVEGRWTECWSSVPLLRLPPSPRFAPHLNDDDRDAGGGCRGRHGFGGAIWAAGRCGGHGWRERHGIGPG